MGKINVYNQDEWIGKRYNKLTVIEPVKVTDKHGNNAWYWKCKCDCGKETVCRPRDLLVERVKSCGCKKAIDTGNRRRIHGENKTRLHQIWVAMRGRCHHDRYKNYGGRGISVCPEWENYVNFRDWALKNGYADDLTIERVDVNGNYEPSNCKWISSAEQAKNRRSNFRIIINGIERPLSEWCEIYNAPYQTVHTRIRDLGWDAEHALTTPVIHGANQFTYGNGSNA